MNHILLAAALLCGAAAMAQESAQVNQTKQDGQTLYTRGIGVYPGSPLQDASPRIVKADAARRNLSLNRLTTASSQFDNNLTAQLATDGFFDDGFASDADRSKSTSTSRSMSKSTSKSTPKYLRVSTPAGLVPRREREWSLDECPYTHNVLPGADSYLQYELHGWTCAPERVMIEGQVAYDATKLHDEDGWRIALEGSKDGRTWQVLAVEEGKGLPGTRSSSQLHDDPDKRLGQGPLPTRNINLDLNVDFGRSTLKSRSTSKSKSTSRSESMSKYSHLRLHMQMPSASHWAVSQANFYADGKLIDMKPAQFFVSAWMSQELTSPQQTEWLQVDLGASADIEQVNLHWVEKAVRGELQTSEDGSEWHTMAPLPGGKKNDETIACQGRGRYVRLLMTEGVGRHYTLAEMEVIGRGGVKVVPQPARLAQHDTLMLSGGNWRIRRQPLPTSSPAGREPQAAESFHAPTYDDMGCEWLPATVPGTALVSYMNAGAVPNTNFANNGLHISESYFRSNFWYRNRFTLPKGFRRDRLYLNFDGINWKANVWLNGHFLGRTEGAFIRTQYEVSRYIQEGENVLAVEVICNAHFGAAKEKNAMNTAINGGILGADNPTFHATVGWDWINSTRGREVGIWNDVYLTTTGAVQLRDPFVACTLNLPDTTMATLTPQVLVINDGERPVSGRLVGRIGDVEFSKPLTLKAGERRVVVFEPEEFEQLRFHNPRLWWPNGYGEPYLYESSFAFVPLVPYESEKKQPNTSSLTSQTTAISFHTGIRQMTWHTAHDALTLYVNGRRFVGKGGNWGFSEHNLLYRGREYDAAVRYHKEMNFTMIRNWVGQIGDDEFYDACDRYGIMVWQDFWLANPCDGPDPDDEAMFQRNAEDMVSRIRQHPSLALYCGRNEGFPPATLNTALRRIVQDVHPGLPYIGSSADDIVSGHGPYWAISPREYFSLTTGLDKFHSERGMPCIMNIESLRRSLSPETLWPQGNAWGEHDFTLEGAQRGASFNAMLERMFGASASAEEFCRRAQWINYDGYRALFESRSPRRRGLLLWMTHPAWPSMVWQTYDYFFEPTAAYFGSRKGCEPLHIQWNAATDSVEVVNYSRGEQLTLQAAATAYDMQGRTLWSTTVPVDSREDTTQPVFALLDCPSSLTLLRLTLTTADGQLLSENTYIKGAEEGNLQAINTMPRAKLEVALGEAKNVEGELHYTVRLRNTSNVCALMTRLNLKTDDDEQVLPVIYEDNYLHLLPGEERRIAVSCHKADTRGLPVFIEVSAENADVQRGR